MVVDRKRTFKRGQTAPSTSPKQKEREKRFAGDSERAIRRRRVISKSRDEPRGRIATEEKVFRDEQGKPIEVFDPKTNTFIQKKAPVGRILPPETQPFSPPGATPTEIALQQSLPTELRNLPPEEVEAQQGIPPLVDQPQEPVQTVERENDRLFTDKFRKDIDTLVSEFQSGAFITNPSPITTEVITLLTLGGGVLSQGGKAIQGVDDAVRGAKGLSSQGLKRASSRVKGVVDDAKAAVRLNPGKSPSSSGVSQNGFTLQQAGKWLRNTAAIVGGLTGLGLTYLSDRTFAGFITVQDPAIPLGQNINGAVQRGDLEQAEQLLEQLEALPDAYKEVEDAPPFLKTLTGLDKASVPVAETIAENARSQVDQLRKEIAGEAVTQGRADSALFAAVELAGRGQEVPEEIKVLARQSDRFISENQFVPDPTQVFFRTQERLRTEG